MKINLKKSSKNLQKEHATLHISSRLPNFIVGPCDIECVFQVKEERDYELLQMVVSGQINVLCQRCMEIFPYVYHREASLAVCRTDADAARYMNTFECITSSHGEIDLLEVVTDDLCLYCPEKHSDEGDCLVR